MKIIGYCRISSSVQDLEIQKQLILEYAQKNRILVDEFIEIEMSSRFSPKQRRIDELISKMGKGDLLIVAEISRLARNMLECLNIINELTEKEIRIIFIRQPELSTNSPHGKLLTAIYSYFAESEREFISLRTKSGLATARSRGVILGRPKGAKNANGSAFDSYKSEIKSHLILGIPVRSILKIINSNRTQKLGYSSLLYFIEHDSELIKLR